MATASSKVAGDRAHLEISAFLTAYDPSDLPGGSIDPLGFERGYLFLADKILPGLTNAGDRPRYFSVLCAGAYLANVDHAEPVRLQYQKRLECVLRMERLWTLANVLASGKIGSDGLAVSGIRGVTYATAEAERLAEKEARRTGTDFKLLSRQIPYGVVGIYAAVADGMRLIDRKTFALSPDLGERLAEGFLRETEAPKLLRQAVREDREVALTTLTDWGRRAHISAPTSPTEAKCLAEALHLNAVRSRMTDCLAGHPSEPEDERELRRLQRIGQALVNDRTNPDLREAIDAILAYEGCYRLAMLAMERLLWLCRTLPAASVSLRDVRTDAVFASVRERLPMAVQRFSRTLDNARTEEFRHGLNHLDDTRRFLELAAAAASDSPERLVAEIMCRHRDVQHGKFDRGRRKMPWLEETGGRISLTMTRVGGLKHEATTPDEITPHPYRLNSADALILAAHDS